MRSWGLCVLLLVSCYEAPTSDEDCSITCTADAPGSCPGDLACEGGYCVAPGQVCRPTFVEVAAGNGFACALDDQAALWCWGAINGETIATRVDTTRRWTALDAGDGQICGLAEGELYCWGENNNQEVTGTISGDVAEPVRIEAAGVTEWTAVSAGDDYTCAIGNGIVHCWGLNTEGRLGDATMMPRGVPTPIASALADFTDVAAGAQHTCAVSTSAGVHCWGRNVRGEVGTATGGTYSTPMVVTMGGVPLMATRVAVGLQSSCSISLAQELVCWGYNYNGQLGETALINPATTVQTAEPMRGSNVVGWTDIEGGVNHYCGLAGDAMYCWGQVDGGGMGNGYWSDSRTFNRTIASGVTEIALGWNTNPYSNANDLDLGCAVVGADLLCWGDNRYGQLGRGGVTMVSAPVRVTGDHLFRQLASGASHTCGISVDDKLYCWGSTLNGQASGFIYGGGSPRTACAMNVTDPTQPLCDIGAPRLLGFATNPVIVTTGTAHTCSLSNGVVTCWGSGLSGNGAIQRVVMQPGGGSWRTLVPTGRDGQCGLAENATAPYPTFCFGNVLMNLANPARVTALDGFTAIALGGSPGFGLYLDAAGVLFGTGDNSRYQMGDGTMTAYPTQTPTQLPGPRMYSAIATRADNAWFACGIRSTDQKVECWGSSPRGQTGTTTTPTTTPNEVPGLSACTSIVTGHEHACAICDGSIYCWGDNRSAQLGSAPFDEITSVPRLVDVRVEGDPWVQLVAGLRYTCARTQAGEAYCWGLSERGALGTGATGANLPFPVIASQID